MGSAESKPGGVSHQDTAGGCPVPHGKSASPPGADPQSCPVSDKNQMPTNLSQKPVSGQARQLDTTREVSSIPSVEGSTESKYWIYPSEQMFFDAMRRKNWDPKEVDMKTVVPIHNAVNERAWYQIMGWEKEYGSKTCQIPRLVRFHGQSNKLSPRARLNTLMGYKPPFDRHDWTIDRCGKTVEYIIDFYAGQGSGESDGKINFYLDVRPKLTWEGAQMRFQKWIREWTPKDGGQTKRRSGTD